MLEACFVCSAIAAIFSVLAFGTALLSDNNSDRRAIMRLTRQLTDTKRDLTECRAKLIKAESDRAFFEDQLYNGEDVDVNELLSKF